MLISYKNLAIIGMVASGISLALSLYLYSKGNAS